ncbi:MAG: SGNH/GDSL hydrolase family protein [Faecalibacterium prausnitzii]|nr:SGNH/GDSL hydrolase family protein [Faecalibacterium prausnitzii]
MKQNTQPEKQSLTPMQKQAVLVCFVCALALLLTIGITMTFISRGKSISRPVEIPDSAPKVEGEDDISDHYQINETSAALLTATADAGEKYQTETLFIGDSNTVRLYANGLISLQQFCAKEGIGTHVALNEGIVTFKRDDNRYTIAQAVAKMKPRRVVIMLGTNDTGMEVADFIANYSALVQAIQTSYPYTDIIVNTVPPVPAEHSNYPNMDQTKIDDFNMALLSMCEQMGLKFLNTAEALKDGNGYGNADYYQSGDIHLKPAGLKILLSYLRTHAYDTEDRRPDTANIPTRAEYTANPSSAVAAPSSSEVTSSSASSEEAAVLYKAGYRVDKNGGGTLSTDSVSGKTSLSYEITNPAQSVTVTAVPESGYVFVKWSDGVTKKTRTDTGFKQNLDVTAVFAAASVKISGSGKAVVGGSYTFKAKISGKNLDASAIRWYSNGTEVTAAAGETTVTVPITAEMQGGTFKIHATVSYNDSTVTSNTLELTIAGAASSSSSSSGSSSSSHSSSSTGSSSSGSSAGSTSSSGASSSETSSSNGTASFSHSTGSSSHSSSSEAGSSSHSSSAEAGSSSHSSSSGSTTGSSSASQSSSAENDASDSNLADKPAAEEGASRTNTETALS